MNTLNLLLIALTSILSALGGFTLNDLVRAPSTKSPLIERQQCPTGIEDGSDSKIAPEATEGAGAALDALDHWKTLDLGDND